MPNYDFYMRGYDVSSQSETFFMIDGNYDELDVWKGMTTEPAAVFLLFSSRQRLFCCHQELDALLRSFKCRL